LYAFLRSQYDKFVTGVAWPGLFIFTLLIIPFIDKYKKFSWKDRPIISAIGITSIAQIVVTTYWGFYIDPDRTKSLLDRLVIDPIFLYSVMILLVPLSFGFTYLMIKLAKNAEANAKRQPRKKESVISLPEKWIFFVFIALIGFQIYLNIAAYYALLNGMKNISLFIIGIMMLVFAGMFHIYRHGRSIANNPPPPSIPQTDRIKSLQHKKRALADSDNDKPGLESSENSIGQIKSNGILNKVFKVARKNKNSLEKRWK
jgi:ubiquinol-cytochrome c reductase cytochrome b subunit